MDASAESLNVWYRDRNKVEEGFRLSKDDTFNVSDVYLKNPNRIQALSMIMVLSLLIYNILEWKLRKRLTEEKKTVRNQVKKQVQTPVTNGYILPVHGRDRNPTIRQEKDRNIQLINMTDEQQKILDLLGPAYEKYYS